VVHERFLPTTAFPYHPYRATWVGGFDSGIRLLITNTLCHFVFGTHNAAAFFRGHGLQDVFVGQPRDATHDKASLGLVHHADDGRLDARTVEQNVNFLASTDKHVLLLAGFVLHAFV